MAESAVITDKEYRDGLALNSLMLSPGWQVFADLMQKQVEERKDVSISKIKAGQLHEANYEIGKSDGLMELLVLAKTQTEMALREQKRRDSAIEKEE